MGRVSGKGTSKPVGKPPGGTKSRPVKRASPKGTSLDKASLENVETDQGSKTDVTITASRVVTGHVTKLPKKLTPRRAAVMQNFLRHLVAVPREAGGGDGWKQELLQALEERPARGKASLEPITPTDVNRWLKNAQFAQLLQDLSQGQVASSSSGNMASSSAHQESSPAATISEGHDYDAATPSPPSTSHSEQPVYSDISSDEEGHRSTLNNVTASSSPRVMDHPTVHGNEQFRQGPTHILYNQAPVGPNQAPQLPGFHQTFQRQPLNLSVSDPQNERDSQAGMQLTQAVIAAPQTFQSPNLFPAIPYPASYQFSSVSEALRMMLWHSGEIARVSNILQPMRYMDRVKLATLAQMLYGLNNFLYYNMVLPEDDASGMTQQRQQNPNLNG